MNETREETERPETATATSAPYGGGDSPPMWVGRSDDPRTPNCQHAWTRTWGTKGERQHRCKFCHRWIWQHDWEIPIHRGGASE